MVLPNPAPGNGPPFSAPYAQETAPTPFEAATAQPGTLTPEVFVANVARMPPQLQQVLMAALGAHPLISSAFLAAMGPAFAPVIKEASAIAMQMQGQMPGMPPGGMPPGAGGPPMGMPPGGPPMAGPGGAPGMPPGPPPGMGGPPPGAMPPGAGGPPPGPGAGGPPPGQPPGRRPPPPR